MGMSCDGYDAIQAGCVPWAAVVFASMNVRANTITVQNKEPRTYRDSSYISILDPTSNAQYPITMMNNVHDDSSRTTH